jgi:hypothetical protein
MVFPGQPGQGFLNRDPVLSETQKHFASYHHGRCRHPSVFFSQFFPGFRIG